VSTASTDLVEVRVLELPVPLWAKSQEHFQDLMREFALIAGNSGASLHPVPARLLELVETLTAEYAGVSEAQEAELAAAAEAGTASLDLVFWAPPQAGPAAEDLGRVLEEADEFCRAGEHLLTLATPPDCVAYRQWYIAQFVDQLAGGDPVPWSQWSGTGR
jgi:hypothetical protein